MRLKLLLLLVPLFCSMLYAAEESERQVGRRDPVAAADTIRAATSKAVAQLYREVSQLPLSPTVTVKKFVKDLDVEDEFLKTLQRADQIGGPRWVDEYTCQVQLRIPANRVGMALKQFAGAYPKSSPVSVAQIDMAVRSWPMQFFSATGSSAASVALAEIRPRVSPQWATVSQKDRQQALAAANAAAVKQSMEAVSPVVLADARTIGDGLADPKAADAVRGWLSCRPLSFVNFREDLQVEVTLSVDDKDYFDQVHAALKSQSLVPLPKDAEEWHRVERDFLSRFRPAIGCAAAGKPAPDTRVAFQIPRRAPDWIDQKLDIQGAASITGGNKLRSRLQAETDGRAKLRERLENLRLDKDLTLGDAAKRDPRIAENVMQTINQAKIYKTQYNSDDVVIYMTLDLGELWDRLRH